MIHEYSALPLRELPRGRFAVRKEHLLAEIDRPPRLSSGLEMAPSGSTGRFRRTRGKPARPDGGVASDAFKRRARVALVVVASLVVLGTAAAATTSWLIGRPAPPAVVSDFGSYTPQLGFHPEPSRAVLVAEDGAVSLYATTNREGTYCLVASTPWKRPETLPDGGTCISAGQAAAPVVAGLVGSSSTTFVIAGRVDAGAAHAVRFPGPDGRLLTRPIGSSGFFVAAVPVTGSPCASGEWKPTFVVLDARGSELTRATIMLARPAGLGACVLGGPHS